jgi:60 kDa SS-A/Ro ribonucleoprotein
MQWANQHREKFDGFIVFTDSETWAGPIHPSQALRKYRHEIHPCARCVVVGMTASEFTIADPNDAGMLDVVGFDSASPALISEFLGQPFGARVCPPDHPQQCTEPPPM